MKKIILLFMALLALFSLPAVAEADFASLGKPFKDFTVTTIDGDTFTLSEALEEREAVLVNLFATWCGPCRAEFPDLDAVSTRYADRVATIAISVEPTDTPDVLGEFRRSLGVSLPMASMPDVDLGYYVYGMPSYSIPTSLLIDRFGNLVYIQTGSFPDQARCERVYAATLGEDYTETRVWTHLPAPKVTAAFPEDGALSDALNAEGGSLQFTADRGADLFPFEVRQTDGRTAAFAANTGVADAVARFGANFELAEDGALAWDMLYAGEPGRCALTFELDGERVKTLSGGAQDWTTWAAPVNAGSHRLTVTCTCLQEGDATPDVGVDAVRLLTGEAAEAALSALPQWPVSDEDTIVPEDGRLVRISANDYDLNMDVFVVPGESARVAITADADVDPHGAQVYVNGPDVAWVAALSELYDPAAGGYFAEIPLGGDDAMDDHLYGVVFMPGQDADGSISAVLAGNEAYLDEIVEYYRVQAPDMAWDWHYVQDESEAEYVIRVVDQNGDGVPGTYVNICTDDTCEPKMTDENGTIIYVGAPQAYHLQVIKVPEGYAFDPDQEIYTEAEASEITIEVTRN